MGQEDEEAKGWDEERDKIDKGVENNCRGVHGDGRGGIEEDVREETERARTEQNEGNQSRNRV